MTAIIYLNRIERKPGVDRRQGERAVKVAILGGGGAMGGLVGAALHEAGRAEVTLVDVARPAVEAINRDGLLIEEKDGSTRRVRVPAATNPAGIGPVDLVVNFVKCYHTEAAITAARPMIGDATAVLTLQNGWGNAQRIASLVGERRVLVGLTYHSGTLVAPGHVKHPGSGITFVGELDGRRSDRLRAVAELFRASGLEVTESERIVDEVWKKLALNVCTLPTSALLRFQAHQLVAHEGTKELMAGLLREVVAVASRKGIALDFDERWAAITGLLAKAIGGRASMLQDVEAKRRTEIDVINGAIVTAGRETGVPVPLNEAMVWLVRSLEEAYLEGKA